MSELSSENEVEISARVLRTSLSETERLLNKFSEAVRRDVVSMIKQFKSTDVKTAGESVNMVIEAISKVQGDFSTFKSRMDILLALLSK